MNPYVWEALKRTLQTKCLQIEDIPEETGFGTASLKPEPIPLDIKVILLGSYEAFEILQNEDPHFNKIFKVRADFDSEVDRTPRSDTAICALHRPGLQGRTFTALYSQRRGRYRGIR